MGTHSPSPGSGPAPPSEGGLWRPQPHTHINEAQIGGGYSELDIPERETRGEGWEWGLVPLTCLPYQLYPKLL